MGSPPRGRGKAFSVLRRQFRFRITPAWAGKSCGRCPAGRCSGDHPRVGGEKHAAPVSWMWSAGSPPRERGKDDFAQKLISLQRITPAWARKSCWNRSGCGEYGDHPRMGGEKSGDCPRNVFSSGSPPRGRGKGQNLGPHTARKGITPAWAGKRLRSGCCRTLTRDHPRVGGEKTYLNDLSGISQGSPPHGRGKDLVQAVNLGPQWITPA